MERIIGQLIEGFGTRAIAMAGALAVGFAASDFIASAFRTVSDALAVLP